MSKHFLKNLLNNINSVKTNIEVTEREQIIRALSKRAAANNLRRLTVIEMEELANQLFGCKNPNYAPDGRPTFKIIENKTVENFFK